MNKRLFVHVLFVTLLTLVAEGTGRATSITSAQPVSMSVNPGGPYSAAAGVPIVFSAQAILSTGQPVSATYTWNFGDGTGGMGQTVSHAYLTNGTFTVLVTAIALDGLNATGSTVAQIGTSGNAGGTGSSNSSGLSVDPGGPYTGMVNVPVTFSANVTANGAPVTQATFVWNFGDGDAATAPAPMHAYAVAGLFTVTVTVTTPTGQTARASTTVLISGVIGDLGVSAGGPYVGMTGEPVVFTGEVFTASVSATGLYFFWDFGDGQTGSGKTAIHTYLTAGSYTVTLTVTAISGVTGSATTTASVLGTVGAFTVAAGGPYIGVPNVPVVFAAQAFLNEFTPIAASYTWNFGDGTTGRGQVASHAYSGEGMFNVTVTATTASGQSGTATASARISATLTEPMALQQGCNNVTSTWPTGTAPATVAQAVTPTNMVRSIWRYDNALGYFIGYSAQPNSPNDLTTIERNGAVFICMSGPGTLARPIL